mgnify:CR=1 FL=1
MGYEVVGEMRGTILSTDSKPNCANGFQLQETDTGFQFVRHQETWKRTDTLEGSSRDVAVILQRVQAQEQHISVLETRVQAQEQRISVLETPVKGVP